MELNHDPSVLEATLEQGSKYLYVTYSGSRYIEGVKNLPEHMLKTFQNNKR